LFKITHIGRNFSDMNSGSKKLQELFPGLPFISTHPTDHPAQLISNLSKVKYLGNH
jgi:hypothetical protein